MRRWPSHLTVCGTSFAIDQGDDLLARTQRLDRQFPVRGPDHRAARVADSAEENVGAGPGFVRRGEHMPAPEPLVMPVKFRTAPSDRTTVPASPKPTCPDVTVTVGSPSMSTKFVGVRVLPTLRPTIASSNPLAALPVSASAPADPSNVKLFPAPGALSSSRADIAVLPIVNSSPELNPMAVVKVRLPSLAVMVFAVPVPDLVSAPVTVPKPLSDPLDCWCRTRCR